jgi:hypothetical protein
MKPVEGRLSHAVSLGLVCAATCLVGGCQTFAPTGLGSLAAKQREQKVVKQAANDPFPSPKDVGLSDNAETKKL